MPENSRPESLLEELETLQDQVLAELDRLNDRIVALLKEVAPQTLPAGAAAAAPVAAPGVIFAPQVGGVQPQMV